MYSVVLHSPMVMPSIAEFIRQMEEELKGGPKLTVFCNDNTIVIAGETIVNDTMQSLYTGKFKQFFGGNFCAEFNQPFPKEKFTFTRFIN